MTPDELRTEILRRKLPADESGIDTMIRLIDLVLDWNQRMNLTAIRDPEEAYEKHLLDCLIPLCHVHPEGKVCDVGSGAGFPGLVWASALPDVQFTLIEPIAKRCTFLNTAKNELNLSNVTVINGRAEEFAAKHREAFDVVTARAVANLTMLSELCVPLVKPGGTFAAMKGLHGEEELNEAGYALKLLGCGEPQVYEDTLPCGETRTLILAEKQKPTPAAYPRPYAKIKQKPLKEKH